MSRNNAGLSSERIVTEALRIIDGQGLRRLTMRRLGDALEVEAMAVYHHFPLGKEQLFGAIVEHVTDTARAEAGTAGGEAATGEPPGAEAPDEDGDVPADERPWDDRLRSWADGYRTRLLNHAGALPLLINRRPDTPSALRTLERHFAAFEEAGLRGADITAAAAALDSYVLGAVLHQVRAESPNGERDPATLDDRYRRVAALPGPRDFDREFASGLDALLAGLTSAQSPGARR